MTQCCFSQVNTNGFIATAKPAKEAAYLGKMPATFGMIAALLGDLDTSDGVGKVYFRQDSSASALQRAGDHVSRAFPDDDEVTPTHSLVVTWVDMAAHEHRSRGEGPQKRVSPCPLLPQVDFTKTFGEL